MGGCLLISTDQRPPLEMRKEKKGSTYSYRERDRILNKPSWKQAQPLALWAQVSHCPLPIYPSKTSKSDHRTTGLCSPCLRPSLLSLALKMMETFLKVRTAFVPMLSLAGNWNGYWKHILASDSQLKRGCRAPTVLGIEGNSDLELWAFELMDEISLLNLSEDFFLSKWNGRLLNILTGRSWSFLTKF